MRKVRELIVELQKLNPDAEVRLLGYLANPNCPDEHDDVEDFAITAVHDGWFIENPHDMVSLEFKRGDME